jgi:hypothetical protein
VKNTEQHHARICNRYASNIGRKADADAEPVSRGRKASLEASICTVCRVP